MRAITCAVLLGLSGWAPADNHFARECARAVSDLDEKQAFAAALGGLTIEAITISGAQIDRWRECQRNREVDERAALLRAELAEQKAQLARLSGGPPPGGGYHIVYFEDGRVVRSAYLGGALVR